MLMARNICSFHSWAITTDGAQAMMGSANGLTGLCESDYSVCRLKALHNVFCSSVWYDFESNPFKLLLEKNKQKTDSHQPHDLQVPLGSCCSSLHPTPTVISLLHVNRQVGSLHIANCLPSNTDWIPTAEFRGHFPQPEEEKITVLINPLTAECWQTLYKLIWWQMK